MEINVYCISCKVEILIADTDTLKSPLIGEMFKVKKDMEWSLFSPFDAGNDLTCPMCEWTFHENGKLRVAVGNEFIIGIPELIIPGIVASSEESPVKFEHVTVSKEILIPKGAAEKILKNQAQMTEAAMMKEAGETKEDIYLAICELTKYKTKGGKSMEGEVVHQATELKAPFVRYFRALDAATDGSVMELIEKELKTHYEYTCSILSMTEQEDAVDLCDYLDWSLKGRISEYFPTWRADKKDPTLEALQKQVEGNKQEETKEIEPALTDIQAIVEGKTEKEVKPEPHTGAWTESEDTDEDSEMNGEAPAGAKIAESGVEKPKKVKKQSRKTKKRAKRTKK